MFKYGHLDELVGRRDYNYPFRLLKTGLRDGVVPQTYPIVIMTGDRNRIYELLNRAGYGVVSLYHTLIEPLRNNEHAVVNELSRRILNLPVHQDAGSKWYKGMIELLAVYFKETRQACNQTGGLMDYDFNDYRRSSRKMGFNC